YIPLNNEQNEPTQGDIGETSNDPTQAKRNEFEELYARANEELYPDCDYVTRLDFMAKFTYFKAKVCNTSRWKDSNTSRKKVPKKVLRYFLIIPRLQRLYKSSHTVKEMTWHAIGKCTELGLAADGFNLFGNLSQSYNMFPVILTTYNLPLWLCMKESYFMLTLLIPGPKSLGKDIDVYLRPLIDDLKFLWAKPGVENVYVATGLKFNMRAMVLWTINDFPARSSLSGWSGQGYKACPTCNEDTLSVRVLGKTAYVGHKRFLKKPHKWRRSLEFTGETKNGYPPKEFSRDAIMTQLARLPMRVKGKHPSRDERRTTQNNGICSPVPDEEMYYVDVARGHSDDSDGDDRPPLAKETQNPNRGGRKADRLDTRGQTKNLGLRRITDQWGPQQIPFEFNDKGTLMPLGDHEAHWSNLVRTRKFR
nr:hypothetical protein [Tanacetum cinerariifolium]